MIEKRRGFLQNVVGAAQRLLEGKNTPMSSINKETLVTMLSEAITEAHQIDSRAVGVVFFGSRTRPNSHPYSPTSKSDVDLVYILRGPDPSWSLVYSFNGIIERRLWSSRLKAHVFSALLADYLMDESYYTDTRVYFQRVFRYFDEFSVAITVNPDVTQRINELIGLFGKKSADGRI